LKSWIAVTVGKASTYAATEGYVACYLSGHGTVIQITASSEEEAYLIARRFGKVRQVYESNQR